MVKLPPSNAGVAGSIPGSGAEIPPATWPKIQNIKQKQYCNKFSKDFSNSPHQKKKKKNLKKKTKPKNNDNVVCLVREVSLMRWSIIQLTTKYEYNENVTEI